MAPSIKSAFSGCSEGYRSISADLSNSGGGSSRSSKTAWLPIKTKLVSSAMAELARSTWASSLRCMNSSNALGAQGIALRGCQHKAQRRCVAQRGGMVVVGTNTLLQLDQITSKQHTPLLHIGVGRTRATLLLPALQCLERARHQRRRD